MSKSKRVLLVLLAVSMIGIGLQHFLDPEPFDRIVPPPIPARLATLVSGFFEILGGVGLLIPRTRRAAAYGLMALFVAVFPANIYMAVHEIQLTEGGDLPVWAMWARLPLQLVFVAWAYWFTREATVGERPSHVGG